MASSDTEICNMTISHLGIGKPISNLETDSSQEAQACRVFYDVALEETLRDFNWPFASVYAELALIEENPNDEYDYSYRYPANCVMIRRILSGQRTDTRDTRFHYKIGKDASGKLIYTDYENAEVEFTELVTDPSYYPSDFVLAFSYKLGALIAPRLSGGDPYKLGDKMEAYYRSEINKAYANAKNEEQAEIEPDSEFIRTRN
jgi:hypothetical protein